MAEKYRFLPGIVFFLFVFWIFFLMIQESNYLGIQVVPTEHGEWHIHRILPGGAAERTELQKGDKVRAINGQAVKDNLVVQRWHIIEQARDVTVTTKQGPKQIFFKAASIGTHDYLEISAICFVVLLLYGSSFSRYLTDKQGQYLALFILLTSVAALAVIPSSMGLTFARFCVVSYIALLPWFLYRGFIRPRVPSTGSKIFEGLFLSGLMLMLGRFGLLFLWEPTGEANWFLRQGIFYFLAMEFVFLLGVFLFLPTSETGPRREIAKSSLVGIVFAYLPFYVFYFAQSKWPLSTTEVFMAILCSLFVFVHYAALAHMVVARRTISRLFLRANYGLMLFLFFYTLTLFSKVLPPWLLALYFVGWARLLLPILFEAYYMMNPSGVSVVERLQLFRAAEREREQLALFIHDTLLQDTLFLKNELETTPNLERDMVVRSLADLAYTMRDICEHCYPVFFAGEDFTTALQQLIKELEVRYLIEIDLTIWFSEMLQPEIQVFLVRTIQECLINSRKHGGATKAQIVVQQFETELWLTIQDNGCYQAPSKESKGHYGITYIREKLRWLEGTIVMAGAPDGTRVKIVLPLGQVQQIKEESRK